MRNQYLLLTTLTIIISLLTGCATAPEFNTTKVDLSLTPKSVIAEPKISHGKIALWGGTVLDVRNLKDMTQIEVLAYPLNTSHRPLQDHQPLGRFIILHKGYLEPATFTQGRLLTVLGSVGDSKIGKIGESTYTYPVIIAQQLHLWSLSDDLNNTSFHFGIGLRL